MVLLSFLALALGLILGLLDFTPTFLITLTSHTEFWLYILLFLVGISVGFQKKLFTSIKNNSALLFIVPFFTILASFLAGPFLALFTELSVSESTAIASGLGWYSLSGVTISAIYSAEMGSIAFLANLLREMVSFFIIPFIGKHLNYPTAIAPAAATSEDTTLSMMIRYTDEETVVVAVFNGIICSAAVPFLISIASRFL